MPNYTNNPSNQGGVLFFKYGACYLYISLDISIIEHKAYYVYIWVDQSR
jgi:hypothetical protein